MRPFSEQTDDAIRLLASEQAARADSDAAAAVMRRLEAVTERAFADLPVRHLSIAVVERIVDALQSTGGMLVLDDEEEPIAALCTRSGAIVVEDELSHLAEAAECLRERRLFAGTQPSSEGLHPLLAEALPDGYAFAAVAVRTASSTLGAIQVCRPPEQPFQRDDVGLLQLAADRVGMALDRARAGERERRARAEAEEALERIDRLQRVTSALPGIVDEGQIGQVLLEETVPLLGATSGAVYTVSALAPTLARVAAMGGDVAGWAHANPEELDLSNDGAAALSTRDARVVRLVERDGAPAEASAHAPPGPTRIAVPLLRASGGAGGALVLGFEDAPELLDIEWLESVAGQGAQALERARLARERSRMYEAERAARAQAEERAQAARVLEGISEGVALVDRQGTIRSWNAAAEAITGVPKSLVVGSLLRDQLPGLEAVRERVPVDVDPRSPSSRELLPVVIAGHELWLTISAVTTDDGTVFAFRDVTDERIVERMRTELVATVSHQLRTPIAGMVGAVQTLLREDIELDASTSRQLLEVLDTQTARLARIVEDMLQVNRLDTGNEQLEVTELDVRELLAARAAQSLQLDPDFDVQVQVQEDLCVLADQERVAQIVDNLVDNARAYAAGSDGVELSASRIPGGMVRMCVRDHGPGIPPGEHDRIFQKFYRLDPDMRRGVGGNGLGLYICRRLAEQMGGRISLDTSVARGTAFLIELPEATACG